MKFTLILVLVFLAGACVDNHSHKESTTESLENFSSNVSIDDENFTAKLTEVEIIAFEEETKNRGKAARLSSEQIDLLLATETSQSPNVGIKALPVLVPTYMPNDFRVTSIETLKISDLSPDFYVFYDLTYGDSRGYCFTISHFVEDIDMAGGSPSFHEIIERVRISAIGVDAEIGYTYFDRGKKDMYSGMEIAAENSAIFSFGSPALECDKPVSPQKTKRIVESLAPLNAQKRFDFYVESNIDLKKL